MKLLAIEEIEKENGRWVIPYTRETRSKRTIREKMYFIYFRSAVKRYHKLEKGLKEGWRNSKKAKKNK